MRNDRNRHPAPSRRLPVAVLAILLLLAACSRTSDGSLEASSCQVTEASASVAAASSKATSATLQPSLAARSGPVDADAPFVPGELIVGFQPAQDGTAQPAPAQPAPVLPASIQANGHGLERVRSLGLPDAALYRTPHLDRAEFLDVIADLKSRGDVAYAHPNYLVHRTATPTDEFYDLLWSYPDIDLPSAWDETVGCDDIAVAVLDTGMLMAHPDRPVLLADGYDFVSDANNLDGDGRDPDPQDPGPGSTTDYHGSHVAGTIAAATNNDTDGDGRGEGIAGTSWRTTVVPVRVLGPDGTISDIVDAMLWAAGEQVSGVPDNATPAKVLNLSLGGSFNCGSATALQNAVDTVRARGVVVIAAAGNANQDASGTSPASCSGVIAVGATNRDGERAPYSNWGSTIDLMAPGGGPFSTDGIFSLGFNDATANHGYAYLSGTSMATAHVAGVAALMFARNTSLTVDDVEAILASSATPLTEAQCEGGDAARTSADCGAGKIDAFGAVTTAGTW